MPPSPLHGKPALVTGGAGGIGLATARALAAAGARVAVADLRPPPEGAPLAWPLPPADLTDRAQVQAIFDALHREDALPSVLVLCAGVGLHERLAEGDPEKWARVLDVNVMGALRPLRAFLPAMLARGEGDVVFVGSVAARRPYAWGAAYAASKAALEAAAEALRLEVQPAVRVTTVAPGLVETPFLARAPGHPGEVAAPGWGALRPEEVADVIVRALELPRGASVGRVVVRPSGQP